MRKRLKHNIQVFCPNDQTYYFDQEELKCHIKAVKWISVTGMIIVLLCTPLFVLASMNWSNRHPVDYEVKVDANETACSNLKQLISNITSFYPCVTETAKSFWIYTCS